MTATFLERATEAPSARVSFPGLSDDEIRDLARGAARLTGVCCADPLADLNAAFRTSYRAAHQAALRQAGPVIVLQGDALTLISNGERTVCDVVPRLFHQLKSVAHTPLAVILSLQVWQSTDGLDGQSSLTSLRTSLMLALAQLGRYGFSAAQAARQAELLQACVELMDEALATGLPTSDRIAEFCGRMRPLVEQNTMEAARLKIDALHARMMAWKSELSLSEWRQLRVVVVGGPMPRRDCLGTQYFSKLLGVNGEGPRVIYAESADDEAQALQTEATHRLDRQIGATFFDDPERMGRDLMSDAARDYLQTLSVM